MDAYYQGIRRKIDTGKRLNQRERVFYLLYTRYLGGFTTPLPLIMDLRIAQHTARIHELRALFPGRIKNRFVWVDGRKLSEYYISREVGQLSIL